MMRLHCTLVCLLCGILFCGCAFLDNFGAFHASKDGGSGAGGSAGSGGAGTGGAGGAGAGGADAVQDAGTTATKGNIDAGTTPPLTCNNFAACDGNVVGDWQLTSSCLTVPPQTVTGCPTASVTVGDGRVTGTFSYHSDHTYQVALTTTETINTFVPKACLKVGATCADLDPANPQYIVDTGTACVESRPYTQPNNESGTYQITGSQVLMTPNNSTVQDPALEFCVKNGVFAGRQTTADGSVVIFFAK